MPRRARCVLPGIPYHMTQRGVDRRTTFSTDEDRHTYLRLLGENLSQAGVRPWAWSLISNHVHLVLVPKRRSEESLSRALPPRTRTVRWSITTPAGAEADTCGKIASSVAFWEKRWQGRKLGSVMCTRSGLRGGLRTSSTH